MTIGERFWAKVRKSDGCWLWTGSKDKRGYGRFSVNWRKPPQVAPRVAWEITNNSPVPTGLFVMHTCDNPSCVNPAHLIVGTARDNSLDASRKGRLSIKSKGRPGERHHRAKLTNEAVREIRNVYDTAGKRLPPGVATALAERFNVGTDIIWEVGTRRTWTHVA